MKKYIVITSIFQPTEAVRKFALMSDWHLIVVGDLKTPAAWQLENVTYLSPDDQKKLDFGIVQKLPWNHYCRKMIGYLHAISQGADIIADTDDDNIPYKSWGMIDFDASTQQITTKTGFINVYRHFTDKYIWPRGLPLQYILADQSSSTMEPNTSPVGVWQYLADDDPDVDAIYRLTSDAEVVFNQDAPAFALSKEVFSPFNSQNTFFRKELFPLLYLPAFVTFRFTDILRGLVAQPIMWEMDYLLGFGTSTVVQKRNPHNYIKDFESEVPMYLYGQQSAELAQHAAKGKTITEGLIAIYERLKEEKIVTQEEVDLLKSWLKDLSVLGWGK